MQKSFYTLCLAVALLSLSACSSEESTADIDNSNTSGSTTGNGSDEGTATPKIGHFLLDVASDDGTEYLYQTTSITSGDLNIKDNIKELPTSPYTWLFKDSYGVGMSYQQQYPGIGYAVKLLSADQTVEQIGAFQVSDRFTTYGFYGNQFVTGISGQTQGDRTDITVFDYWDLSDQGAVKEHSKAITTENLTGDGEQATFSGIIDRGDGTFLTAMIKSSVKDNAGQAQGGSIGTVRYPDSCWVVKMDTALNVLAVYGDDRISYACGQFRSQCLNSIYQADDGYVYVFSNSYDAGTTHPAGALRIKNGVDGFDKDYYFNIQEEMDGYKFRRVWPISGSKFLLEFYASKDEYSNMSTSGKLAVVDMDSKTFTWVTGFPEDVASISIGYGDGYDGYYYLPISPAESGSTGGGGGWKHTRANAVSSSSIQPAIYKINATTGVASVFMTFNANEQVKAINIIKK